MSEWKNEALENITVFIKDGSHGSHKDFENGVPLLSAKDIEGGKVLIPNDCRRISQKDYEQIHTGYQLQENDLALTIVGTIGRVAIVEKITQKFTFQRSVGLFRINTLKVLPIYCYHFFTSNQFQQSLERSKNASAQGGVYLGELAKIKISYPEEFSKQHKIAKILSSADSVIANTQVAIAKYKAIKQGMLNDLFTRGIDIKTGKLRPSYADAPELYKESALGWIPLEWEVKQMEDVISEAVLGIPIRGTSNGFNIPLLKMGNLFWGELILKQVEQVRFTAIENENFLLKYRDLLFNTRNTPELVGKTAIWRNEFPIATFDNNLLRIRFKKGFCSPFVCLFMSFGAGKSNIKSLVDGTTSVAAVYWKNFKKFKIPFPCETEQESIIKRIETIDKNIQTEQQYLHKLQQLKTGLMADLLSGKKKVEEE